jgi:hypothetical protein
MKVNVNIKGKELRNKELKAMIFDSELRKIESFVKKHKISKSDLIRSSVMSIVDNDI